EYFRYYGIEFPGVRHWIGSVMSGPFTIAAQVFQPEAPVGTLVFIHGYYDHTGLLANVINESIHRSYTFAAIDLPGHGLSGGMPASIDDFSRYGDAIRDFLRVIEPFCQGPLVLAGHSTGCSAIYEYLAAQSDPPVAGAVFAAPLVRNAFWHPGKAGYHLVRHFFTSTFRWYRNSSHDTAFLAFQKRDPLGYGTFPLAWAKAHHAWERRIRDYPALPVPVVIIQGDRDETVDWRYNCRFLQKKFDRCTVHLIKGARHHLLNEALPYRARFMELFFGEVVNLRHGTGK
ncbi:MAG: alpha/beta hydrolase, partial [Chitinispirillaceae bacterium]|nr:alpha/beta hydrolase [Chitinispirillaceae bacterium]